MGKTLVIAEKPSVGRDIGRVLKCGKKIDGALEGSQYIVTWGLGHLVTLADPEHYDKKIQRMENGRPSDASGEDGYRGHQADRKAVSGSETTDLP